MGPLKRAERDTASQLARCDREIARIKSQPGSDPAWLSTMGIEDWEWEKRLILEESDNTSASGVQRTAAVGGCVPCEPARQ